MKTHSVDSENEGFWKRWFDLHIIYILHNAPSIKNLFLRFSMDGRKRYENGSVDVKLLLRFQWNENEGLVENVLVWAWPKLLVIWIASSLHVAKSRLKSQQKSPV